MKKKKIPGLHYTVTFCSSKQSFKSIFLFQGSLLMEFQTDLLLFMPEIHVIF